MTGGRYSPSVPKYVDAEERRATMARAAARLIAEHGIDRVRLADVAAEVGWTTGAVTHYFPNKRALLIAAMTVSLEQRQGSSQTDSLRPGSDALRSALEQVLPLDEDRIQHWRVSQAFMTQSWGDAEISELWISAFRRWRDRLLHLFREDQLSGRFRDELDPVETVDTLLALVDGVSVNALYDPELWPAERQLAVLRKHVAALES